jgi:hypothetical protein
MHVLVFRECWPALAGRALSGSLFAHRAMRDGYAALSIARASPW